MSVSKDNLFAKYEGLANQLEQHFLETNDKDTPRRIVRLTRQEFDKLCKKANDDPIVRDWLYCIEHGYPGTRRIRRNAA